MRTSAYRRNVIGELDIVVIVEPGIYAYAAHALPEAAGAAVDFRRRDRPGSHAACGIWESPRRRRVPNVLHRRVVVDGDAQDQFMVVAVGAAEGKVVCVADIGVVESETVSHTIVSQLYERPQTIGDLAGVKKARLLGEEEVAILGIYAGGAGGVQDAIRNRRTGVGIGQ